MQREDGRFHNNLGYDRRFKDEVGSEDSMGRSLWATGYTLSSNVPNQMKQVSKEIFDKCLPSSRSFSSPRAIAFTLKGLHNYYKASKDETILRDIEASADNLLKQYLIEADQNWHWFERYLTYGNARIPQALFQAYESTSNKKYLEIARESLDFLIKECFIDDIFQPIGSNGWYRKGGKKAIYDQQPLEASCMVEAALNGMKHTKEKIYCEVARHSFEWYFGKNIIQKKLIDEGSNLCYDGITKEGINQNQGAESTLSYLLAYLLLKENKII
jgi:rhamnogalacturonyl hydrolase YesR